MFQAAHGSHGKVAALDIGPRNDGSWHLTFPFPYNDADVMRLVHRQGYLLWVAFNVTDPDEARYNVGTALDAARVCRSRLDQLGSGRRLHRIQDCRSGQQRAYRPAEAFSKLPGLRGYENLWKQVYETRVYLVKHAGRAAKSRTALYHLGMGKALALDAVAPAWEQRYFAPGIWLDDLSSRRLHLGNSAAAFPCPYDHQSALTRIVQSIGLGIRQRIRATASVAGHKAGTDRVRRSGAACKRLRHREGLGLGITLTGKAPRRTGCSSARSLLPRV